MVRLTKSPLPPDIKITSETNYRSKKALDILANDCHRKCYICEDKPTTINVEHIVSHRNDPALKYDWNNLFIACGHCNSIKGTRFDAILDPTKCDPENHIELSVEMTDSLIGWVKVESLTADSSTMLTVQLLDYVYNGGLTTLKEIECLNLRDEHLKPNIQRFNYYINEYRKEPELGYGSIIIKEISRSSAFAAFKRKIVRDDPDLAAEFADALK